MRRGACSLSREGKTPTLVAGTDDDSSHRAARSGNELDEGTGFAGEVLLGKPKPLSVPGTGVLG